MAALIASIIGVITPSTKFAVITAEPLGPVNVKLCDTGSDVGAKVKAAAPFVWARDTVWPDVSKACMKLSIISKIDCGPLLVWTSIKAEAPSTPVLNEWLSETLTLVCPPSP